MRIGLRVDGGIELATQQVIMVVVAQSLGPQDHLGE
jgi:hypothetical protein